MDRTEGHLLGGRVRYAQPKHGFRSGLEPVLLAAAVPARPGERVLEGGSGAGAALLCLASRVPGLAGLGVEQDAALARIAAENAVANDLGKLCFAAGSIESIPGDGPFDHAFANPPYHLAQGTRPDLIGRNSAKHAPADTLTLWAERLAARLRPRGTLTMIVPAARLPECLDAFAAARCGSTALSPLWPRQGHSAKLILVGGIKNGRGPSRLLPGLVLHELSGSFTAAADAILRHGEPLALFGPNRVRTAPSPDAADTKAARAPRPGFPCSAAGFRPE